jgi:hypothetical protein
MGLFLLLLRSKYFFDFWDLDSNLDSCRSFSKSVLARRVKDSGLEDSNHLAIFAGKARRLSFLLGLVYHPKKDFLPDFASKLS